jgi:hypothetical protein
MPESVREAQRPGGESRAGRIGAIRSEPMRFVFKLKTKSGSLVEDVYVDARNQKEAEQRVIRENPSCTIVKCDKQ